MDKDAIYRQQGGKNMTAIMSFISGFIIGMVIIVVIACIFADSDR